MNSVCRFLVMVGGSVFSFGGRWGFSVSLLVGRFCSSSVVSDGFMLVNCGNCLGVCVILF